MHLRSWTSGIHQVQVVHCSAIGAEDDLLAIRRPHRRGIRRAREGDFAFLAAATQIDDVDVGERILPSTSATATFLPSGERPKSTC